MFLLCYIPRFPSSYSPSSCSFSAIFPGFYPNILHHHVPSLLYSQVSILIFSIIMFLLCHIPRFPSSYSLSSCSFSAIFPAFHPNILHYHVPSLPHSQVFILIFSIIIFLPCLIPRFPSKYSLYHFFFVSSLPYSQSQVSIRVFNEHCLLYFLHKPHRALSVYISTARTTEFTSQYYLL
jgi:hypothetical protein